MSIDWQMLVLGEDMKFYRMALFDSAKNTRLVVGGAWLTSQAATACHCSVSHLSIKLAVIGDGCQIRVTSDVFLLDKDAGNGALLGLGQQPGLDLVSIVDLIELLDSELDALVRKGLLGSVAVGAPRFGEHHNFVRVDEFLSSCVNHLFYLRLCFMD